MCVCVLTYYMLIGSTYKANGKVLGEYHGRMIDGSHKRRQHTCRLIQCFYKLLAVLVWIDQVIGRLVIRPQCNVLCDMRVVLCLCTVQIDYLHYAFSHQCMAALFAVSVIMYNVCVPVEQPNLANIYVCTLSALCQL